MGTQDIASISGCARQGKCAARARRRAKAHLRVASVRGAEQDTRRRAYSVPSLHAKELHLNVCTCVCSGFPGRAVAPRGGRIQGRVCGEELSGCFPPPSSSESPVRAPPRASGRHAPPSRPSPFPRRSHNSAAQIREFVAVRLALRAIQPILQFNLILDPSFRSRSLRHAIAHQA